MPNCRIYLTMLNLRFLRLYFLCMEEPDRFIICYISHFFKIVIWWPFYACKWLSQTNWTILLTNVMTGFIKWFPVTYKIKRIFVHLLIHMNTRISFGGEKSVTGQKNNIATGGTFLWTEILNGSNNKSLYKQSCKVIFLTLAFKRKVILSK